jgi:hypothetical protein
MPRDPYHEIGELLRSTKPDPRPSPGLEARIVRSLPATSPAGGGRVWRWFLLPPAVAAAIALMWPQPAPQPVTVRPDAPALATEPRLEPPDPNPLARESLALRNDARRAGRFLINCLPGLADPAN